MHDTAPDETAHSRSSSLEFVAYTKTGPPPFNVPADFIIRTPQGTDWHVSAAILAFASPYIRALPRDPPPPGAPFVLAVPESDALRAVRQAVGEEVPRGGVEGAPRRADGRERV